MKIFYHGGGDDEWIKIFRESFLQEMCNFCDKNTYKIRKGSCLGHKIINILLLRFKDFTS